MNHKLKSDKDILKEYSKLCRKYHSIINEYKNILIPINFYRGCVIGSLTKKKLNEIEKKDPEYFNEIREKFSLGRWLYKSEPKERKIMYGIWCKREK